MRTRTLLASLAVTAVSSSAFAVSPYDVAYGLQWSFQAGSGGGENATDMDVTADGIAHMIVRSSGNQTFGEGATNSINSDVGGVNALGQLVYGSTLSSMPGYSAPGQNYPGGANAAGNKIYYGFNASGQQYWNDPGSVQDPVNEIGKSQNTHSVFSIDSSMLDKSGQLAGNASLSTAIGDRVSLSIYEDNFGTPRTDGNGPITTGMSILGVQIRSTDSAMQTSTLNTIMVNDMVSGDFGTAGDYGGYNLRSDGTANAYLPGIGRYNPTTKVLDGPAKQPILTHTGATGSNMGVYLDAGVDQASGWYYGGGISHSRTESTSDAWDPDGSGASPSISFTNSFTSATSAGIATAYDASNMLQYAVTWDSAGYDAINAIVGVGDGSNAAIFAGEAEDDAYFEKRDATGAVVWSVDLDYSMGTDPERISEVTVDGDGNVWVQGYFTNSVGGSVGDGSGGRDGFIGKYDSAGNEIWTTLIAGGDTETASDGTSSKLKSYIYSTTNGQWDNTTGHIVAGNDILLQKLVPGDFDASGIVDMTDVGIVDAATASPLVGVDTYDFNEDGNSDFADVSFFVLNILDLNPGDTDGDGDVDDSDLGTSFANYTGPVGAAGGKTALEGDTDGDGDVDDSDLGTSFAGYTGPLGPAEVPEPTSLALLGLGGLLIARRRRA